VTATIVMASMVTTVVYSARSLEQLEHAVQFLRAESPDTALNAAVAIQSAVENLVAHPFTGRRVEGDLRELVIAYGNTGYLALYRFVVRRDEVRILALRRQREVGYVP
jgi:plasmid stabilization system protein ParE